MRNTDTLTAIDRTPQFLSIQAQDFIEDGSMTLITMRMNQFLSIQAQDFIEECVSEAIQIIRRKFLSIQAQDFIEEGRYWFGVVCRADEFLSIQAQDFIEEASPTGWLDTSRNS